MAAAHQELTKLSLPSGQKYGIRSESPFGYLDKSCYIDAARPATNELFEVVHHGASSEFASFYAPRGSYLAVHIVDNKKEAMWRMKLEERGIVPVRYSHATN